jgi:hypothetical protein
VRVRWATRTWNVLAMTSAATTSATAAKPSTIAVSTSAPLLSSAICAYARCGSSSSPTTVRVLSTVVRVSVGPAVRVGSGLVTRTDCGVTRRSPTDTASRCATAAGNAIWPGAVGSAPVLRTCASRRVSVVVEGLRCDEVGRTARSHQPTPMRVGTRAPRRRAPGG